MRFRFATSPSYVPDVERTGLNAIGLGPLWRWDSAIDLWPDGRTVAPEDTLRWAAQSFNRDITVPFVQATCDLLTTASPCQIVQNPEGFPKPLLQAPRHNP